MTWRGKLACGRLKNGLEAPYKKKAGSGSDSDLVLRKSELIFDVNLNIDLTL